MADILKVALIQTSLTWEDPEANRKRFTALFDALSGIDLVVLPEMFTTGFTMEPHKIEENQELNTVQWLTEQSHCLNAALAGSIIAKDNGKYFNRLYFVTPEGTISTYDKRHTFTLAGEDKVYERGTEKKIVSYNGFQICLQICYDLRFPVWSRNTEDFDVLLYVANWPSARVTAWDTLLKARAIENMVYCIGVNRIGLDDNGLAYSGHSAIYDCLGETLAFSEKEGILYAQLSKEHINTAREGLKFLQDRDSFNLLP